jgi:hypothetical protein
MASIHRLIIAESWQVSAGSDADETSSSRWFWGSSPEFCWLKEPGKSSVAMTAAAVVAAWRVGLDRQRTA